MSNNTQLSGNVSTQAVENEINSAVGNNANVKKNSFDEKNYLNLKLNPGEVERKVKIRILPASATNPSFCTKIKTHSLKLSRKIAQSGFKAFPCLNDPMVSKDGSQECPLCKKAKEYFDEAKKAKDSGNDELSKTLFKTACSFLNKETYILRVIERGKENEGVKFWRFNANSQKKGYFDELVKLYKTRKEEKAEAGLDPDYNIFDLNKGRDFMLTLTRAVRADGKETVSVGITDSSIETPLSNDIDQANAWINDPKVWSDAYSIKDAEYLSIIAEGLIPVKDKTTGHYVGKREEDFTNSQDDVVKAKELDEVKKNNEVPQQTQPLSNAPQVLPEDDDDLPF